jgi:predicted HicB family RNase H-like nuclease
MIAAHRKGSTLGAVSYRGYVANVEFDAASEALVGRVVNAREALDFRSRSAADVLGDFHQLIDRYLADCEQAGVAPQKPYSGKLLIRIDPTLHAEIAAEAGRVGQSINAWVERAVRAACPPPAP